jgi:hypothetical protein
MAFGIGWFGVKLLLAQGRWSGRISRYINKFLYRALQQAFSHSLDGLAVFAHRPWV